MRVESDVVVMGEHDVVAYFNGDIGNASFIHWLKGKSEKENKKRSKIFTDKLRDRIRNYKFISFNEDDTTAILPNMSVNSRVELLDLLEALKFSNFVNQDVSDMFWLNLIFEGWAKNPKDKEKEVKYLLQSSSLKAIASRLFATDHLDDLNIITHNMGINITDIKIDRNFVFQFYEVNRVKGLFSFKQPVDIDITKLIVTNFSQAKLEYLNSLNIASPDMGYVEQTIKDLNSHFTGSMWHADLLMAMERIALYEKAITKKEIASMSSDVAHKKERGGLKI